MKCELLKALTAINSDKGIPVEYMTEKISKAVAAACKNMYGLGENEPSVQFGADTGELSIKVTKEVVEDVKKPAFEISLNDAKKIKPESAAGDFLEIFFDTRQFGRIAAQTARNIIRQGIREGERKLIAEQLSCHEGEIVTAQIIKINSRMRSVILRIGEHETMLPRPEFHLARNMKENDYLKVYVLRVESDERSLKTVVSRACPNFLKKLFESEIPEIADGTVEIKAMAREAGSRAKVAVDTNNGEVDPVGACIGTRGSRIKEILNELGDEKVDVIRYYEEPEKLIESAISPAQVLSVEARRQMKNEQISFDVTVPDNQISLAIGARGQNVRLASRLTGWKIDLRPESGYYGDD